MGRLRRAHRLRQALLSNDMHLDHQIPDIWYETDLQRPNFHAAGVTLPGRPISSPDTTSTSPGDSPPSTATCRTSTSSKPTSRTNTGADGSWHPIEREHETIHVRGGSDVASTSRAPITAPSSPR